MKKFLSLLLSITMLLSAISTSFAINSIDNKTSHIVPFSLESLDPSLTLSDAIKAYPEILDTYYVVPLSEEDAQQMLSNGVRSFELDDNVSAVDILSSLNAQRT